jgi:hypothetical protein
MECPRIQRWQLPRRRHSACVRAHAKPSPPPLLSTIVTFSLFACPLDPLNMYSRHYVQRTRCSPPARRARERGTGSYVDGDC